MNKTGNKGWFGF